MKRILLVLTCVILCLTFVLSSCNNNCDDNLFEDPSSTKPKKTTEATTAGDDPTVEMPTNLRPEIIEDNEIVSRLTAGKGITVDIYNGEKIELNYHGWPTVCKGEDGTLYASASLRLDHVDPFGIVVFYESHDNGETWSDPVVVADTVLDDRDSGVLYLGNGKIMVNWFCHDASHYLDPGEYVDWQKKVTPAQIAAVKAKWDKCDPLELRGGSFISVSEDGGKTWGEPQRVPVKSPHGMTMGQDGRTLYFFGVPAANWQLSGATGLKGGYAYLFMSRDYGKTWSKRGEVALPKSLGKDVFFDECYTIQLKDGSFIGCIRTERSDLGHWTICVTRSRDGVTWDTPKILRGADGEAVNGAPPHLLQLSNGVVLLAYTCRNGQTCGSRFRLSYDNGETWTNEFILCISDQPKHGDLGYPSTVELDDGTLLTTYYQAYGEDRMPSLLYTRWRLTEGES